MKIEYQLTNLPTPNKQNTLLLNHKYTWGSGRVSSSTHFQFGPGCEDYAFLDHAVDEFECGLDSILTDSIEKLELDTYFCWS